LIADTGMIAVIHSTRSRNVSIPHDANRYKARSRIERCFNQIKRFRHFATHFDRRAVRFLAFIHIAIGMMRVR
jgi:transposase